MSHASVYESTLTPDSVVTCLFHDCERSLWSFCLVWHVRTLVCDDESTVHTQLTPRRLPVLRVCAVFEFCFVFRFGFRANLLDFTSPVSFCTLASTNAQMYRVLPHFVVNTVAHAHRWACVSQFSWRDHRPISCTRSAVTVAATARLRPLFVARCALVRNSLQTSCLQWVMTR